MKIAILGSGGREHALALKISKSPKLNKLYCIPGNAGTSNIAENVNLDINNFIELNKFVDGHNIDLLVVGPEKPLVDGIVDFFEKKNIKIFGPRKKSARLEGSKIFTKKICEKYKIPTAKFGIFEKKNEAIEFLYNSKMPIVIKADVLASGKGVFVCNDFASAKKSIIKIFDGEFGRDHKVLIEEFLEGDEMSYFIISDGENFKSFNTAQDHKRVGEGDVGKNTGGMGAYSPSGLINEELEIKIINKIIKPTLKAIREINDEYKGFLYAGLMIKNNEPYLIEYNVRMGDPECQTILPLLKSDLLDIIISCCEKKLDKNNIEWHNKKSLCVVLCSKGYPENYKKNIEIPNISELNQDRNNIIYHAGTKIENDKIYAIGGRVLNFVSISDEFKNSRNQAMESIKKLNWKNGFFRSDIGYKIIN